MRHWGSPQCGATFAAGGDVVVRTTDPYLDLLKKSLCFSLWDDPGLPFAARGYKKGRVARAAIEGLDALLDRMGLRVFQKIDREGQREGRKWALQAHSMIGLDRMDNVQQCVEQLLADDIPGDLIETGVWRGGTCIFMRGILAAHESDRRVFVADSFAGLPPPDTAQYPQDSGDRHFKKDFLAVSQEEVMDNFRQFGLLDDQVVFVKGWFRDTLHTLDAEQFALIRLDGDLYQSTMEALEALYPKLSPRGFCIIDDYALEPCARAVHDYREHCGIEDPIEKIDWTGVFWRKS
jgi:O-methyltransferase